MIRSFERERIRREEQSARKIGDGIEFLQLLCLLFIGLKLGGVIDWHWAFVLMPLYAPLLMFIFAAMAVAAMYAVLLIVEGTKDWLNRKMGK